MKVAVPSVVFIVAACLVGLSGCVTGSNLTEAPRLADDLQTTSTVPEAKPDATGSAAALGEPSAAAPEVLGNDPKDDLGVAKQYFRQGGFGLAERYFRRAVELHPRDAEAWIGLAASYDRLRRFDLADRAYKHVVALIGPTPEVLNNQGYSYMLRGDYRRARATLLAARAKSPENPYIRTNLELLAETQRKAKAVN